MHLGKKTLNLEPVSPLVILNNCGCAHGIIFLCTKDLKWSDKHDVVLCREVLVMGLNEHRYGSKEIGDVCRMV